MPFLRFLAINLAAFLLGACAGPAPALPSTSTITAAPTPTVAPTITATPTLTPVNTPTSAPRPTPTVTAIATVSPEISPAPPTRGPIPDISLVPFLSAAGDITFLANAGDGSGRMFLVEKAGRVHIVAGGVIIEPPFLDITDLVDAGSSERGLLSIAFDPDYKQTGEFYINYTRQPDGATVVGRYRVSARANVADPASGQVIIRIDQPAPNHNGGQLQFGPDGYLYIGTGDGGSGGDPWDNAENLKVLLGKMLRLNVRGQKTYAIPPDNPFRNRTDARPEIWAYGLRNPWRFSFDRLSGDLWIADVGQDAWEEVNFQAAGNAGGRHYGWDTMEGTHCFEPKQGCDKVGKVLPVSEYGHDLGCSITGGYVYRGSAFPELIGAYFYSDYCTGLIWGLYRHNEDEWRTQLLLDADANIASFGEDENGELYALDLNGQVYRLVQSITAYSSYLPFVE